MKAAYTEEIRATLFIVSEYPNGTIYDVSVPFDERLRVRSNVRMRFLCSRAPSNLSFFLESVSTSEGRRKIHLSRDDSVKQYQWLN